MIVCPNCNHENPEGATQCESCFTPLPHADRCPNCGANIQSDATFCGQCGFSVEPQSANPPTQTPDLTPKVEIDPTEVSVAPPPTVNVENIELPPEPVIPPVSTPEPPAPSPEAAAPPAIPETPPLPPNPEEPATPPAAVTPPAPSATVLQSQRAILYHVQTKTNMELPQNVAVIHIGKPNENVPPDIDVSGFPDSEIVSRVHADIRVDGDLFFLEDVGSSNGTYVNHTPLIPGNRHKLKVGDRIALGKGDKMTFLFQLL